MARKLTYDTKQRILEKAVQKALDNGWTSKEYPDYGIEVREPFHDKGEFGMNTKYTKDAKQIAYYISDMELIYNHDFAKALWGEDGKIGNNMEKWIKEIPDLKDGYYPLKKGWKYHLKRMVIADEPLKYLGENLE